jgi:hypothetical protein
MAIYSLGQGMKRIDVPENSKKNNLQIGTVLKLHGYNEPEYVIVENMGINEMFPQYGTRYKRISLEDYTESICDSFGMDHISQDKVILGIHLFYTDKIKTAEEIMDIIKLKDQAKINALKAAQEADQRKAAELDYLKKEYSYLETVQGNKKSGHALGAANIRKELKLKWPNVKFSIRSESYSMGCSINISWTDAITTEKVDAVTNKYQYGTFDAMTDCAGSIDSQFIDLFGGARFVHTSRHLSPAAYNKVAAEMYPQTPAFYNPNTGNFDGVSYETSENIKRATWEKSF